MTSRFQKTFRNQPFVTPDLSLSKKSYISAQTDVLGETSFAQMDVYETPDDIFVEMDLPGVNLSDINVSVQKQWLTVEGVKKETYGHDGNVDYLCMERDFGPIKRVLKLSTAIDTEAVIAKYVNGVLEIRLPKRVERRNRTRHIQIEGD